MSEKESENKKDRNCELCGVTTNFPEVNLLSCHHPKNGYCAYFRYIAKKDAKQFNMHTPINKN